MMKKENKTDLGKIKQHLEKFMFRIGIRVAR